MYTFGVIQFSPSNNVTENIVRLVEYLEHEKDSLFLLPELFLSDYFNPTLLTPTQLKLILYPLINLSLEKNISLAGSVALIKRKRKHNQFVFIRNGILHITDYSKQRLFKQEKEIFDQGISDVGVIEYKDLKIATKICFDIINPVSVSKICSKNNVDILLVSASVSVDYLLTLTQARSLENQIISLFANRGRDPKSKIKFLGTSSIFYPDGTNKFLDETHQGILKITVTQDELLKIRNTRKYLGIYEQGSKRETT